MRVLIVDDQEFIRRGIRAVLSEAEDIEVCGEAQDGREAIVKSQVLKPDVVIMDISMPRLDGLEATREIRRILPEIAVLTLSQYELPDVRKEALEAGAATHVSKIYVWTQLVAALRRVHSGDTFFDGNTAQGRLAETRRDRAALEKALRESEERFRCTFELTSVGLGHASEDGSWLRVNQRLCEMLGYGKEEIQRLKFQEHTHPADLAADLAQAKKLAAGEIDQYSLDERYLRKDGGIARVHLTVLGVRDAERKLKYCIRVAEDIGARKDAEEKLTQAKRDWQRATDHLEFVGNRMSVALSRCSRDLRYTWVNQNYANWLERPIEKIVGRLILDVLGKEAFQKLRHRFDQVLAGENVEYEDHVVYAGIGSRDIFATYIPTFDDAGIADGWMGLVQDITGRKRAGGAARQA